MYVADLAKWKTDMFLLYNLDSQVLKVLGMAYDFLWESNPHKRNRLCKMTLPKSYFSTLLFKTKFESANKGL